jgi:uncharacterized membrane protein
MNKPNGDRKSFLYVLIITILSVSLIILNLLLGMVIPFTVQLLIYYVAAMLIFVVWHAVLTKGWKRSLIMFGLSFVIAFTAEALGVNFGLVFGHYYYTNVLGFQIFGVPLLAALAWEPILYAAFCITDILAPALFDPAQPWLRRLPATLWMAVVGALATTAWDMMIDPIAVSQGWWVWVGGGSYMPDIANGVPVSNFIGWLGVSFVVQLIYRLIADRSPQTHRSMYQAIYGPLTLYASLFLTSLGVTLTILQRTEIALVGLLAMGPFMAIAFANINLLQRGLAVLLSSGWLELDLPNGRIKAGQP